MEERHCDGDGARCGRVKVRPEKEYRDLVNRLSRIEGQIRGIRRMVEENAWCPDILAQSSAAAQAINAFNRELILSHMRTCVAEDVRAGKDETLDEMADLLRRLMK